MYQFYSFLVWSNQCSNPRSIAFEESTLTIGVMVTSQWWTKDYTIWPPYEMLLGSQWWTKDYMIWPPYEMLLGSQWWTKAYMIWPPYEMLLGNQWWTKDYMIWSPYEMLLGVSGSKQKWSYKLLILLRLYNYVRRIVFLQILVDICS
jgi:hypothetical protein